MTDTTPTWATYKGHGKPERFVYFGINRKAPRAEGIEIVEVVPGTMRTGITADGRRISLGGSAYRFWAAPVVEQPEMTNEPEATCRRCGAPLERGSRDWVDARSGDDGGTYDVCPEAFDDEHPNRKALHVPAQPEDEAAEALIYMISMRTVRHYAETEEGGKTRCECGMVDRDPERLARRHTRSAKVAAALTPLGAEYAVSSRGGRVQVLTPAGPLAEDMAEAALVLSFGRAEYARLLDVETVAGEVLYCRTYRVAPGR